MLITLLVSMSFPVLAEPPRLAGCAVFPADNIWNVPVDTLPVDPNSSAYIATVGANVTLHPDFGSGLYQGAPMGIPYVVVPGSQAKLPVAFTYREESEAGPYPDPARSPHRGRP